MKKKVKLQEMNARGRSYTCACCGGRHAVHNCPIHQDRQQAMNKHRENTKVLLDRGKLTGVVEFNVALGDKHFTASRNITESDLISFEGELKANKLENFKEQAASIRNQTDMRGASRPDSPVLTRPALPL